MSNVWHDFHGCSRQEVINGISDPVQRELETKLMHLDESIDVGTNSSALGMKILGMYHAYKEAYPDSIGSFEDVIKRLQEWSNDA